MQEKKENQIQNDMCELQVAFQAYIDCAKEKKVPANNFILFTMAALIDWTQISPDEYCDLAGIATQISTRFNGKQPTKKGVIIHANANGPDRPQ